jgi:hypothetical protein
VRVISIDPGSRVTGVAVITGPFPRAQLVDLSLLKAPASWGYVQRVASMAGQLQKMLAEYPEAAVIIEMPDGKRHGRMGKINMAALSVYGVAAGVMLATCWGVGRQPRCGSVNETTRRLSKVQRQRLVQAAFPAYRPESDKGMDGSDAAFMGWHELQRLEEEV